VTGRTARRRCVPVVLLALLALSVALLASPGAASGASAAADVGTIPTSLATSIPSAAGTWVTLPMGHLDQPLNTFWQLFFRPTGATSWTDKVTATATATNGGLVLAAAAGQPTIVGVRPSHLLHFSPLISSTDGGHSWDDGVLPDGLASDPAALATSTAGRTLALVGNGSGAKVLADASGLSQWRTLTTVRRLASTDGAARCGLRSLSAVAALAGQDVVGGSCGRIGTAGIFSDQGGSWHRLQPALPAALRRGPVQVLTLLGTPVGLTAILGVGGKAGTALVAAWLPSGHSAWTVSPVLSLAPGATVVSLGLASGSGLFALSAIRSGAMRLDIVGGPGAPWAQTPSPPRQTATLAFGPTPTSPVTALAAHKETLTAWSLATGAPQWQQGQVLHVALPFGSSSSGGSV
jgi:hypothetical protein